MASLTVSVSLNFICPIPMPFGSIPGWLAPSYHRCCTLSHNTLIPGATPGRQLFAAGSIIIFLISNQSATFDPCEMPLTYLCFFCYDSWRLSFRTGISWRSCWFHITILCLRICTCVYWLFSFQSNICQPMKKYLSKYSFIG